MSSDSSTLFMATVTISVPDALMARDIRRLSLNLPVPRKSLELNCLPAIVSLSDIVIK